MKKRMVVLLALATMAAMLTAVAPPAQAGPYIVKVHFICKAKIAPTPLMYPSLQDSQPVTATVNCGKGKPKNPAGGNQHGLVDETYCRGDILPLNFLTGGTNKKPTVTKLDNTKPAPPKGISPSNCRINTKIPVTVAGAVAGVGPSCGLSKGTGGLFNITAHTAPNSAAQKVFDATINWRAAVGGVLPLEGTFVKKGGGGGGNLVGVAVAFPDRLHKGASCTPPGTTQFKIVGFVIGLGIKP